jgi:hypothetical protein
MTQLKDHRKAAQRVRNCKHNEMGKKEEPGLEEASGVATIAQAQMSQICRSVFYRCPLRHLEIGHEFRR